MRQIRFDTFETNSSSTHAMLIPTEMPKVLPKKINFHFGQFGWEMADANPADYLYTALFTYHPWYEQELFSVRMQFLKDTLDEYGIEYTFQEPVFRETPEYIDKSVLEKMQTGGLLDWDCGEIDHSEELGDFLEKVFSNKEFLISFLVDGKVRTGNDNCMEMDSVRYWRPDDWGTKNYIECYKCN